MQFGVKALQAAASEYDGEPQDGGALSRTLLLLAAARVAAFHAASDARDDFDRFVVALDDALLSLDSNAPANKNTKNNDNQTISDVLFEVCINI